MLKCSILMPVGALLMLLQAMSANVLSIIYIVIKTNL